jgi:hypothetical protein
MFETDYLVLPKKFFTGIYNKLDKNTQFALNTRINRIKNRICYSAPADPWHIIYISTTAVSHRCDTIPNTVGLARVETGDWDLRSNNTEVGSYWLIKGLKQRFEEGWDWHETVYYETVAERIEQKGSYWGYDSTEEFEKRLAYNDGLFKRISEEGYKPNRRLDSKLPGSDVRTEKYRKMNEVEVLLCVGRDGEFLLKEGHHRFAIADVLGIDIPVLILARHQSWQEKRDQMGRAGSIEDVNPELQELLDHPDMDDVRPSNANRV